MELLGMALALALALHITRDMGALDATLTATIILGGEALLMAGLRF